MPAEGRSLWPNAPQVASRKKEMIRNGPIRFTVAQSCKVANDFGAAWQFDRKHTSTLALHMAFV